MTSTATSITLEWTQWMEGVDPGDAPVIEYVVYARPALGDWAEKQRVDPSTTSVTLTGLEPDTDHEFSVAAIREGEGGIGPRSPSVIASTNCESKSIHFP